MKSKIQFFLIYLTIGIVSYFSYKILYNTSFDLGLFCDASTECYELTQKSIIFNWFFFLILIVGTSLLMRNKIKCFIIVILVLLFNILKLGSNGAVMFLFILNLFTLLFSVKLMDNEKKNHYIIAFVCMIFIYLFEMFYVSEIFYFNTKYDTLETLIYISLTLIFLFSLAKIFLVRKKRNRLSSF